MQAENRCPGSRSEKQARDQEFTPAHNVTLSGAPPVTHRLKQRRNRRVRSSKS